MNVQAKCGNNRLGGILFKNYIRTKIYYCTLLKNSMGLAVLVYLKL